MRFGSTAEVLSKVKLNFYRSSEWPGGGGGGGGVSLLDSQISTQALDSAVMPFSNGLLLSCGRMLKMQRLTCCCMMAGVPVNPCRCRMPLMLRPPEKTAVAMRSAASVTAAPYSLRSSLTNCANWTPRGGPSQSAVGAGPPAAGSFFGNHVSSTTSQGPG